MSTQHLYNITANRRPQQPDALRRKCEDLWADNFQQSHVKYNLPPEDLSRRSSEAEEEGLVDGNEGEPGSPGGESPRMQTTFGGRSGKIKAQRNGGERAASDRHHATGITRPPFVTQYYIHGC